MIAMFQYLFYTIIIETPLVILFYRKQWKAVITVEFLLNCFTWPILSVLYYKFPPYLLLFEAGVFLTEAIALKLFFSGSWLNASFASFTANAASLLIGAWIQGIAII